MLIVAYIPFAVYVYRWLVAIDGGDKGYGYDKAVGLPTGKQPRDFIGSANILVYPLLATAEKDAAYVAVSNGTVMLNTDGRCFIAANNVRCSQHGYAGYLRLPPPGPQVESGSDSTSTRVRRPEGQCLPVSFHRLVRAALTHPDVVPAVIPLLSDTGSFHVDMANSLIREGYFVVTD